MNLRRHWLPTVPPFKTSLPFRFALAFLSGFAIYAALVTEWYGFFGVVAAYMTGWVDGYREGQQKWHHLGAMDAYEQLKL